MSITALSLYSTEKTNQVRIDGRQHDSQHPPTVLVNRSVMAQCLLTACDPSGKEIGIVRVNPDSCCAFFGVVRQSHVDRYSLPRANLPDSALLTSGGVTSQRHWHEFFFKDRNQCYSVPLIACPDENMPPNSVAILGNWLTVIMLGWDLTQISMATISHHIMLPAYQGQKPRFIRKKQEGVWTAIPNGPLPRGPLERLPIPGKMGAKNSKPISPGRNPKVSQSDGNNNSKGSSGQKRLPAMSWRPQQPLAVTFATQNRFANIAPEENSDGLTNSSFPGQNAPPKSRRQRKRDAKSMKNIDTVTRKPPAHRGQVGYVDRGQTNSSKMPILTSPASTKLLRNPNDSDLAMPTLRPPKSIGIHQTGTGDTPCIFSETPKAPVATLELPQTGKSTFPHTQGRYKKNAPRKNRKRQNGAYPSSNEAKHDSRTQADQGGHVYSSRSRRSMGSGAGNIMTEEKASMSNFSKNHNWSSKANHLKPEAKKQFLTLDQRAEHAGNSSERPHTSTQAWLQTQPWD